MTGPEIAALRLYNQQVVDSDFESAKALVTYLGAVQAQDYPMSKWALGSRLPGSTDTGIEAAIDRGEIIRTHVLRPTWHLAPAEDIGWMLELTGQNILRQFSSMNVKIGLDDKTFTKSTNLIVKALEGGKHLTRDAIVAVLNQNDIRTNEYRSLHILAYAELHGIICSGPRKGKHHSYALMAERIKNTKTLTKDQALAELAKRYFTSHGPASLKDFIWWSGLSVSDSKKAVGFIKDDFAAFEYGSQTFYWKEREMPKIAKRLMLLPAFDEYLISYKDRTPSIDEQHMPYAFTKNGIFRPIIVWDGQVVGIWKRTVKGDNVIVEPNFLQKVPRLTDKLLIEESKRVGAFMEKNVEVLNVPR